MLEICHPLKGNKIWNIGVGGMGLHISSNIMSTDLAGKFEAISDELYAGLQTSEGMTKIF